jgi:hypothetical protein
VLAGCRRQACAWHLRGSSSLQHRDPGLEGAHRPAETNKSEQFNGFAQWSFFGGEGIIAENIRHEQRKGIKYNHLVANMIILHNVVGMTRVLQELRDEGTEIRLEILAGLAPFRTAHINRFGDYTLDFRRKIGPLNFDATIIPMDS